MCSSLRKIIIPKFYFAKYSGTEQHIFSPEQSLGLDVDNVVVTECNTSLWLSEDFKKSTRVVNLDGK